MRSVFCFLPLLLFLSATFGNFAAASNRGELAIKKETTVKDVIDKVVSNLYKSMDQKSLIKLDVDKVMSLFSKEDLQILATQHWVFDVNVPVIVSVMISKEQKTKPFWLLQNGFIKTDLSMNNRQTTYEIWQKTFSKGSVGLGVNGFENGLALHYFVSVAPQKKDDNLTISNVFPINQHIGILKNGATTYLDWDELVLQDVPESMCGQKLLTTTRGRASESHLVGAFRTTSYPSSGKPDQFVLTWSGDPDSTIDIQWRTNNFYEHSKIQYKEINSSHVYTLIAEKQLMEDRLLANDRFTFHYTARLKDLRPGATYQYLVDSQPEWTDRQTFKTSSRDSSFSFLWFGDTHHSPKFGEILNKGFSKHPDVTFFSIVGDLVSDGLNRNQWDDLFRYIEGTSSKIPFMSVPGNHDNRAGLGAKLYCDLFSYPLNGPKGVPKEQTYSFIYKNTLFLMIDATSPIDSQTVWIEHQLAKSEAMWKVAMFHFPPYNWEEPYLDIQKAWVPLFDKYHVDLVFGGHLHYYMRSKPMNHGKIVPSYQEGTAYIISVGIPNQDQEMTDEPYAEVRNGRGHLYQYVKIEGNKLYFESVNSEGKMIDSFQLKK